MGIRIHSQHPRMTNHHNLQWLGDTRPRGDGRWPRGIKLTSPKYSANSCSLGGSENIICTCCGKGHMKINTLTLLFPWSFWLAIFQKKWGKGLQKNIYGNTTRDVEKLRMYRKTTWKSMKHLVCFQAAEIAALERWLSLLAATPPPRSPGSGPRFGVFMDCWCYRSGQPPGILLKYCK